MSITYEVLRDVLVGSAAMISGGVAGFMARKPSRVPSRLGMRGLHRQRALEDPVWATFEPIVRWMGVRMNGVLSDEAYAKLDTALLHAGDVAGLTADEYFGMMVLTALLGSLAGIAGVLVRSLPSVLILLTTVTGALLPYAIVDGIRAKRFRDIQRGLPYAIDLITLAMSAGLDFPGAVQETVSKGRASGVVHDELSYILQQFQLGRTRTTVLRELATRAPVDCVVSFTQALVQAEERGTAVVHALETQAVTMRERRTRAAENAASDMNTMMAFPIGLMAAINVALISLPTDMLFDRINAMLG